MNFTIIIDRKPAIQIILQFQRQCSHHWEIIKQKKSQEILCQIEIPSG